MDACSTGGCEMIQLLLDSGADTIAKDDSVIIGVLVCGTRYNKNRF